MNTYISQIQNNKPISFKGWAMDNKNAKFKPFTAARHALGEHDVFIEILYAGICHSDIHSAKSEWGEAIYPIVPGHEICGVVRAVGSKVTKFRVGEYAGVGCMVNSCGECVACAASLEQFCERGAIYTYNCRDYRHDGAPTYGGYSDNIVVSEHFAVRVPEGADLARVAPLLCAGITTYSPIKFSEVKKGDSVAVAGFGGLGVMALKYLVAIGAEVSVFARNKNKLADAMKLGAKALYDNTNVSERFDFIISTIPTKYDVAAFVNLLKIGGEMAIVGNPPSAEHTNIEVSDLIFAANKKVYGSLIGGIAETQEMLDVSVAHNIYPEIELITADKLNWAYEQLTTGRAKFRYVIDMKKSLK